MITRRNFVTRLAQGLGATLAWPSLQGCQPGAPGFQSKLSGPNFTLGHRLRTVDFGPVTSTSKTGVVIIGGGVSGLSAARYLKKYTNDFTLLELGDETGGNAVGGQNTVSSYPWGAHYLPLPTNNDQELTAFLQEAAVITGYENNLPVFNDYYLCFDPKERLYINQYWQEGLIPHEGVPKKDRDEIERFLALMHDFKNKKGADGREAFTIPLDQSSRDTSLLQLDEITMEEFMNREHFRSPYLKWYVNYCCADDYGASISETSAWAGIHYFASRKGSAFNASSDAVLTWPDGNYWLVKQLRKNTADHLRTNSLVYKVQEQDQQVEVLYFDAATNTSHKLIADSVIMAAPQFIAQRLLGQSIRSTAFHYNPWMVANITTSGDLQEKRGEPLCWDNVIYQGNSLGYVNAMNQQTGQVHDKVLTYYRPLVGRDAQLLRKQAYEASLEHWTSSILEDLKRPHPGIESTIQEINVWVWGHGMIRPSPGFIWGQDRVQAGAPWKDKVFFAHSDVSGVSIFEEAFYRGHTAAANALKVL